MNIKITDEERMHFKTIYDIVSQNFPKKCSACERIFKNELDYNLNTVPLGDVMDYRILGMGFFFFRNHIYRTDERRNVEEGRLRELRANDCPLLNMPENELCRTTLTLNIGSDDNMHKLSNFMDYVKIRSIDENQPMSIIMNSVREDYNRYLIAKDLHTLL